MNRDGERRGIPLRAVVPNAVTALALCVGLTGVRFAIAGQWENAMYAIVAAGVLLAVAGAAVAALTAARHRARARRVLSARVRDVAHEQVVAEVDAALERASAAARDLALAHGGTRGGTV